ncbi:OLE1 Fatty-acid desaturase [uncultured Caudovirales phage]|uniref:OLE1 Fatty-acid desaturase n=1 Tax=uncultured Caudovirales phage TaxID=2100421 RepID=A0A6J5LCH2_9CAUD|nr:OLE1 Fatty-acid desaturase [uncultured Caudovirales phage]
MLIVIYTLLTIHLGCIMGSLYMHRYAIHRQYEVKPWFEKTMKVMYWILLEGVPTDFIVQHRKHHELSDSYNDPHSPRFGYWSLLRSCLIPSFFVSYQLSLSPEDYKRYSVEPSDSFIEANPKLGVLLLLIVNIALFSWWGIASWIVHLFTVNFLTITTITVFGHAHGYKNFELGDYTTNIVPIGILSIGEELHNNHHSDSRRCNYAIKDNEFDLGYFYLKILEKLDLVKLKER